MSIVYDFPSIAARLRKDDFFTPTPRVVVETPLQSTRCYRCEGVNVEPSTMPSFGAYFCNDCNNWF